MLTQNRIAWIALIIVITLGLSIEALKSTRNSHETSSWRPRIFGMQDIENEDQTVDLEERTVQAKRARSRLLRGRVAGLSQNAALAGPMPVVAAANPAGPPIPNLTPLKLVASDDAKKKADEAKKKKKKKKKKAPDEAMAQYAPPQAPADDAKKSGTSSDVSGGSSMYGGSNRQRSIIAGGNIATNTPETLEQWLAYILREPNYDHTLKMIQQHDAHVMDSEIFHEVITQMLADSRPKMHEYAVFALGSSPSLKSFLLLEQANYAQADGSPLKIQSRTYLKAYAKLENLRYLAGVISGAAEANSSYEAMRLIQVAVADYKPNATPPTSGPTASAVAVSKQFSSLVPVLNRLLQTSNDATLVQEATTTLRQVQTIVGTTPTPAV